MTNGTNPPELGGNGVLFNGTNDILIAASKTYTASDNMTYFLLFQTGTQSSTSSSCCRPVLSFTNNSSGLYPWIAVTRTGLSPDNHLFFGWTGTPLANTPASPGDEFLVTASHDGDNKFWNTYLWGSQTVTNQTIPGSYSGTTVIGIGGDPGNAARRFAGEILEVVAYDRLLTPSEQEEVEGYLACKWEQRDQLPLAHTYYHADPTSEDGCPSI